MTKAEAIARIENIEGVTGSRATALVEALDALGLLHLTAQVEQILDDQQRGFREIKDRLVAKKPPIATKSLEPLAGVDTYDALGPAPGD